MKYTVPCGVFQLFNELFSFILQQLVQHNSLFELCEKTFLFFALV